MALNFPSSPSVGDQHSQNSTLWEWTGSSWDRVSGLISNDAGTLSGIGVTQFSRQDRGNDFVGITTFNNNVQLLDNDVLKIGTGTDLQIYHESSTGHSWVKESGSGSLIFASNAVEIKNAAGTEFQIKATADGAVDLYYNNSKKFETTLSGATLTGTLVADDLDISTNVDIDGTLEADAYTVNGTALNEYIADTVGSMVSSNTETNITVTYEDSDNTLDFVIGTLN